MKNIDIKRSGTKLTITIDTSQTQGASKSGKSQIIATTGGNVKLDDGVTLGINVYK